MNATALWHVNQSTSELQEELLEDILDKDFVSIKTQYSMLSTGTESAVCRGQVSNAFLAKMKVPYMKGDFSLPVKYGYACCGRDSNDNLFHFMHPHQDKCRILKKDLFSVRDLDPLKVPLVSNMETILNAIWDADLKEADRIAIIGYGNIGCLLAETINSSRDLNVTIFEENEWRLDKAVQNGSINGNDSNEQFDVIFNTTASASAIDMGIKRLNVEGSLVQIGWYMNPVKINLGSEFHYNRLRIISSQVSNIPLRMKPDIDYKKRKEMAAALLQSDGYDKLITNVIDFKKAPQFFNDLRNNKNEEGLIYIFKY